MNTVISDFEKRSSEIKKYFALLDKIISNNATLYIPGRRTHKYLAFDDDLQKVMKANMFLLLYNLAESSIRQAIIEIYDRITTTGISYSDSIEQIQKIWIRLNYRNFKDTGENEIFRVISEIGNDVIQIEFDAKKRISGNIDGMKIRGFADELGFSSRAHHSLNNGTRLHTVKTQRNKLAHGEVSFAECGRDYTVSELGDINNQVVKYLNRILLNIKKYLDDENYRAPNRT